MQLWLSEYNKLLLCVCDSDNSACLVPSENKIPKKDQKCYCRCFLRQGGSLASWGFFVCFLIFLLLLFCLLCFYFCFCFLFTNFRLFFIFLWDLLKKNMVRCLRSFRTKWSNFISVVLCVVARDRHYRYPLCGQKKRLLLFCNPPGGDT